MGYVVGPMKAMRIVAGLCALVSAGIAFGSAGACTGTTECTPEELGLTGAARLEVRELPGRAVADGPCASPRTDVIASDAELRRLYEELGLVSMPDGAAPESGPIEYPTVDFSRERVIVREGPGNQGISWVAAKGDSGVLGLLACYGTTTTSSCVVNVVAVPTLITRAETRTCDAVRCGAPAPAPTRLH